MFSRFSQTRNFFPFWVEEHRDFLFESQIIKVSANVHSVAGAFVGAPKRLVFINYSAMILGL